MNPNLLFKVIPWNGYKAAISLTFDDGDLSQLETAIPELSQRELRGTFFLIANRLKNLSAWKEAAHSGHEIGNHTLDHPHSYHLTPAEAIDQIKSSRQKLENDLNVEVPTFAYPFTEITPALRESAQTYHFLSRGGYGSFYISPDDPPDWHYLPSQVVYSHTSSGILKGWVDQNILDNTWSVPQFHAFTGSLSGWQPFAPQKFKDFLNYLVERKNEIWVAPLGEIGAYAQAQEIFEKASSLHQNNTSITFKWVRPDLIPSHVFLKIRLSEKVSTVYQNHQRLEPIETNVYSISFDAQELVLNPKI